MGEPRGPVVTFAFALLASSVLLGGRGGEQRWLVRYDGPLHWDDYAQAARVSPDGSAVYVTGWAAGETNGYDFGTFAYRPTDGRRLWSSRYDGPKGHDDYANALAVSPDGSLVYVTGATAQYPDWFTPRDYATVAIDAAMGTRVWSSIYDGPDAGEDFATSVAVSPDGGRVYVTGYSDGASGDFDYATIAYDTSTGAQVWLERHDGLGSGSDTALSLGVSPDGARVFVTGVEDLYTSRADYFTAAYDAATGYPVWASRYNGPAHQEDEGRILTVSADGSRVFVTGNSMNADLDWDYATVAYDAMTGTRLWASRYDGPAHSTDFPHAIQASPRGDVVFVTGESEKKLYAPDYTTIAYDTASGGRRWLRRYDGPGKMEDRAYGLAVAPDGAKIYVTGESWGTDTSSDYATIAYDAGSGSPLWLARYDGPLHRGDTAMAMAVVPDGHLMFVTGHSAGVDSGFDYTTIEYEG